MATRVGRNLAKPPLKFAEVLGPGAITVPGDFVHEECLRRLHEQNRERWFIDDELVDPNFPNPTRILRPGDRLLVRVFRQISDGDSTSEERMAFLAMQNAVYTGAQGAALVFEQLRERPQKGFGYISFDEGPRLWKDTSGEPWVPILGADLEGSFEILLNRLANNWDDEILLLCFTEV
jgi:hypothetical protein